MPEHMAWVAAGSAAWAASTGAGPAALGDAEDGALSAVVTSAAAAGVRWLTIQEPTSGRGLLAKREDLARSGIRLASLEGGSAPVAAPGLTVLLTRRGRGRAAIVEAVRRLARDGVDPGAVDEKAIGVRLDAPDVDLLVHTGGDRHVHDLLLWEVAYSELVVLETPWPAVGRAEVADALAEYRRRDRRYGGIVQSGSSRA